MATRETSLVYAISLVGLCWRDWRGLLVGAMTFLVALAAILVMSRGASLQSLHSWFRAMHHSSASHPLDATSVGMSFVWLLSFGPLPIVAAIVGLTWQRSLLGRDVSVAPVVPDDDKTIRWVVLPAALASAALFVYPDGSFSPRYWVATAPLAFFIVGARVLDCALETRSALWRRAAWIALVLPLVLAGGATGAPREIVRTANALPWRLRALAAETLLVPGHYCPHVRARLAAEEIVNARNEARPISPPRVALLCPGWDWPASDAELQARLDAARCSGVTVSVDTASSAWIGPREVPARDAVRAYARARVHQDASGWSSFSPLPADSPDCVRF